MKNNDKNYLFDILLSEKPSLLIKDNEDCIFKMIPELEKCKNFDQNNPYHIYDVYEHILHVVDGVPQNIYVRLAAFFHDIGKPYTYFKDDSGLGHFYGHFLKSNKIFLNFSKKYELDEELTEAVSKLIYFHDFRIDKEKSFNLVNEKLSITEAKMLFQLKRSDLLAHASNCHYLLKDYDIQEKELLKRYNK